MRRSVAWTEHARAQLAGVITFIAADNPAAARQVREAILLARARLGTAATGRAGRVAGTYEKPVLRLPYIMIYAIQSLPTGGERVVILHLFHAARDRPQGGWPES